jgi:hypothetical protein
MTAVDDDAPLPVATMSPDDLRAEAAGRRAAQANLRDSAAQYRRLAYEEGRAADQCGYEAGFLDEAAAALGMLLHARRELPALESAAEGAVTSERLADDKLRKAAKNLTRRQADERRLDGRADVSPEVRDEAAVRTRRASRTVDAERAALAAEHARRQQADLKLNELQLRLAGLETAWAAAAWRAQHPGEAPRTSPMMLGGVTAADMTGEERQFLGGALALMAASSFRADPAPAKPDPGEVIRDQTRFRSIGLPGGRGVIIPPRAP